MNPYAVTPPATTTDARPRATALAVALLVTAPAVVFAAYTSFGPHGLGSALYGIAIGYFLVSHSSNPNFYPLNASRLKIAEFGVLIAICGVFHGLALPGVTSNCAGRRSNAAIVSSNDFEPSADEAVSAQSPESEVAADVD
jgi:ABC-type transporter Mla maintaining outer membrane lipid asymmetry permease subunit MlaE